MEREDVAYEAVRPEYSKQTPTSLSSGDDSVGSVRSESRERSVVGDTASAASRTRETDNAHRRGRPLTAGARAIGWSAHDPTEKAVPSFVLSSRHAFANFSREF